MLEANAIYLIILGALLFLMGMYCKEHRIILAGHTSHSSKKIDVVYVIIFVIFWLFAVCVTESYDITNYRYAYDEKIRHGKEVLFDNIQLFFAYHGWSFDMFKALWVTAVMILLYIALKRYSKYPCAVAALAIITPLFGYITQMRSALAGAIFLNAFELLLSGKKKERILYIIIIILSAQIHTLAYAFLIFLFINPKESRSFNSVYYIVIFVVVLAALFFTTSYSGIIVSLLNKMPIPDALISRISEYFQGETTHFRYAFFLAIKRFFLFYLTDIACIIKEKECESLEEIESKKYGKIKDANKLMLIFLPIAMASASFDRLFNCFCLIQYATVFNAGKSKITILKRISWRQSIQSIMVVGVLLFYAIETYFNPSDLVTILNSVEWIFK